MSVDVGWQAAEKSLPCPVCGSGAALVLLGDRVDHPHRWLPWLTTVTHICACTSCDEIVQVAEGRDERHPTVPVRVPAAA